MREIVQEGVADVVAALKEYEEINQKFGLPEYYEDEDKMNELFTRQGELQDILDATDAWNLDSRLDRAMAALRCPPADRIAKATPSAGSQIAEFIFDLRELTYCIRHPYMV